ncbi:MAG: hypothetical protein J5654_08500 [Victivallales bacterium]|nr:hypothetical protein [Victivallales bacterium]
MAKKGLLCFPKEYSEKWSKNEHYGKIVVVADCLLFRILISKELYDNKYISKIVPCLLDKQKKL